ncbi:MAG TPA: hypothetical protein VFH39_01710 [Candidatus Saccharimonadales bacterium]|nr:hypothetical protein [Candidatus Saccharimonadales bacterium]
MGLLTASRQRAQQQKRADAHRSLLHYGARVGGDVFGPIPKGHRREFFCLDERTWVWHEEWTDPTTKQYHVVTTRYDVQPQAILKSQGSNSYQKLSPEDARNFYQAVKLYGERFGRELDRIASGN